MREPTLSVSTNNQTGVIGEFISTARYLADLRYIDNPCFKQMECHIYPTELQLCKADYIKKKKSDQF